MSVQGGSQGWVELRSVAQRGGVPLQRIAISALSLSMKFERGGDYAGD